MHFVAAENIKPYKNGVANKSSRGYNPSRPGNGRRYTVFVMQK